MCRPLKIDVSTFEDRWLMCRPSKIDGNYAAILAQNIDTILVCDLGGGFALHCFHYPLSRKTPYNKVSGPYPN